MEQQIGNSDQITKDTLYSQWKNAEAEFRRLGQECHQLIKALDSAKARKKELEPISQSEWDTYRKQQDEIGKELEFYRNIGDEEAAKMRVTLRESQNAYAWSDGARAKDLSIIGHGYERDARNANEARAALIQRSKTLKASMNNSPVQIELRQIKSEIKRLWDEFNTLNAQREVAKKSANQFEAEFRKIKKTKR